MTIPCKINPLGWVKDTGGLPAGYTRLDYLESPYGFDVSGVTALFSLGDFEGSVEAGDAITFETAHQIPSIPSSWTDGGSEGFWNNYSTAALGLYKQTRSIFGLPKNIDRRDVVNNMAFAADGGGTFGDFTMHGPYDYSIFNQGQDLDTDWHVYRGHLAPGVFQYSRDGVTSTSSYSPLTQSFTNLTVFGVNGNNGVVRPKVGRKKYFKFWLNGILKIHLVPCLDTTSTPCMFDLVTGETYYNAGSGLDFIPSPT